ncbi:MAG: ABC transporter permease subunit [Candidatus Thorarchaeota archaeon]
MSRSKPMIVALADLRMTMKVKYVRYSLIAVGLLGPIMSTAMMIITFGFIPPGSPDFDILVAIMMPMGASMLALVSVIPATLIAANTLVGEREQKTLEPLLATPLTDRELIWGKTLSALIPSVILLFGGTAVSTVAVYIGLLVLGATPIIFPDLPGMFLIFCAGPVVVLAVVSVMVLISSRVTRVYEAYQTGTLAVMIFLIPMFGSFGSIGSIGTGISDPTAVWVTNIITFLIASIMAIVTWAFAIKQFNRDHLVTLV